MDWTIRILDLTASEAETYWRALWEHSPQRSPFSSLPYAQAAADAWDLHAEMHLVMDGQVVVAGLIAFWRQRGPYRVMVIPPFTQYTPLVVREEWAETDVHARTTSLEPLLASLESRFHIARSFSTLPDVRPARWRGWQATPFYTYRLQLGDEATTLGQWSSSTRRTFRKNREAYRVEEAEDAAATIALCEAGYAEQDRPLPANPARLKGLVDQLRLRSQIRIFTATPDASTRPEAGLVVLHDGQTAHYWIAGSKPGPAMTVLLGECLPRLFADGLKTFDFVGANMPSIAEFKRRFGPTLTPYHHLEKIMRPELRILLALRALGA